MKVARTMERGEVNRCASPDDGGGGPVRSGFPSDHLTPPTVLTASVAPVDPQRPPVVVLTWQIPGRNPADASVTIQRATDANFTQNLTTFAAGPGQRTFADATPEPQTAYFYRARTECPDGCSTWSEGVRVVTGAAGSP